MLMMQCRCFPTRREQTKNLLPRFIDDLHGPMKRASNSKAFSSLLQVQYNKKILLPDNQHSDTARQCKRHDTMCVLFDPLLR